MRNQSVEVFKQDSRFIVRVCEDNEKTERDFGFEAHAYSWAAGQRIRLGLSVETIIVLDAE